MEWFSGQTETDTIHLVTWQRQTNESEQVDGTILIMKLLQSHKRADKNSLQRNFINSSLEDDAGDLL